MNLSGNLGTPGASPGSIGSRQVGRPKLLPKPSIKISEEDAEARAREQERIKAELYAPLTEKERMQFVRAAGLDILKRREKLPEITKPWLFADEELVEEAKEMLKAQKWKPQVQAGSSRTAGGSGSRR